jgi:hypothetical protein
VDSEPDMMIAVFASGSREVAGISTTGLAAALSFD